MTSFEYFLGDISFSQESRPILWFRLKYHQKKKTNPEELKKFAVYIVESFRSRVSHPVETATLVVDMKPFSVKHVDISMVKFLVDVFSTKYPENLGAAYLVDSPFIFGASWKLVSPLVDPRTRSKFRFISTPQLSQFIDRSQIIKDFQGEAPYIHPYPEASLPTSPVMKPSQNHT
jgi:hypothetical protein